ncbi:unnamed protein product [Prorocentrum cordatum]|uniref:Solute carrier family 40 protein n=1 Tax=Prorocentrum cordatum TaxID=2364126 RepID=A0ABN9TD13_9DINO|nr:unnamed protein product [Polarella glacialis]
MQQVAGLLSARYPLKRLYVLGEALNLVLVLALVPALYGATSALMAVNVGLGLTQAFTAPVAKSMPPAVVAAEDLAIVNSWDLTGDKIGRNLAPLAFTVVSSIFGFEAAIGISTLLVLSLVLLKQLLQVADRPAKASSSSETSAVKKMLGLFKQVWAGILSLKEDRTIGLMIVNTICTNMLLYPLGTLVFPVIFKAIPDGAIENEGSMASALILWIQGAIGIQKKKAWMNYAAVVSLGGVIGPFLSNAMVYLIQGAAAKQPPHVNWIGIHCGIIGQLVTLVPLMGVIYMLQYFSAGTRVFLLFVVWGAMTAANNVTTIYFNAHTQQRLGREKRGSFIANILTLFTLANTLGSSVYGWVLASGDVHVQLGSSTAVLMAAGVVRIAVLLALNTNEAGKETMVLKKTD